LCRFRKLTDLYAELEHFQNLIDSSKSRNVLMYSRILDWRHTVPVVIPLAVNITLLDEAGAVWAERGLAFAALEAPRVPLLVYRQ
jgi:hypothetical protein